MDTTNTPTWIADNESVWPYGADRHWHGCVWSTRGSIDESLVWCDHKHPTPEEAFACAEAEAARRNATDHLADWIQRPDGTATFGDTTSVRAISETPPFNGFTATAP